PPLPSSGAIVQPTRRKSCNYRLRNGANQESPSLPDRYKEQSHGLVHLHLSVMRVRADLRLNDTHPVALSVK
ncbi:hypothetical protein, partial [Xanthomonas cucurbitae]|uniref:hypothetical protein n=1 Tax=Xanthomonas cucurbitae TaxID=56453 RepID=UPI001B80B275